MNLPRTEDFVFAIYTTPARMPLVVAGRSWRKGCRTVVATNELKELTENQAAVAASNKEIWIELPDNTKRQSKTPADFRGALLVTAAHRLLQGGYKWMLWADDDTLWFPAGAVQLLSRWDYRLPHAVTDNFWPENMRIPMWNAPRCMPCDSIHRPGDSAPEGLITTAENFTAPLACPICTSRDLCNNLLNFGWQYPEWVEREGPGMCNRRPIAWPENEAFTAHGGTGVAISQGAAAMLAATSDYEQCVHDPDGWNKESYLGGERWNSGGDGIFTRCLWTAGYGVTDTGTALQGTFQAVDRLEYWNFTASTKPEFIVYSEYDRTWRRRERKRLFGGTGQGDGNFRELVDVLGQWSSNTSDPQTQCADDPFCLAELTYVQQMVSSHASAKWAPSFASHGHDLARLYTDYVSLLKRLGLPQSELPELPIRR